MNVTSQEVAVDDAARDGGIATLPPAELSHSGLPISPSTGQPRRAKVMVAASVLLHGAALVALDGLALSWWRAIHMASFATSSQLVHLWQPRPGGWRSIVAIVAVFAICSAVSTACSVAALNAWNGHRWSRVAAALATVLALLGWLVNPVVLAAAAPALVGTALLWTPPVTRYFSHWEQFRAGERPAVQIDQDVTYGPLPRYV